jgi:hypothetical protein
MAAPTYLFIDNNVSTTVLQTTTIAANAVGAGRVLVAVAKPGTGEATFQAFGGLGGLMINADSVVANSITANELAASLVFTNELLFSGTGKIRVGKTSASDTASGLWIGTDGAGGWDAHFGDATNYIWWDDSANTFTISGVLNILNAVQSFTPTWGANGFSSDPTGDLFYLDLGAIVYLWARGNLLGTSDDAAMTITNLPTAIRPSSAGLGVKNALSFAIDNGNERHCVIVIGSDGTVTWIPLDSDGHGLGTFATSGQKGLAGGTLITYPKF